jgi:ribose transport system permease protein
MTNPVISPPAPAGGSKRAERKGLRDLDQGYIALLLAMVLAVVCAFVVDGFANLVNLRDAATAQAPLGILAIAIGIVIIGGGIDLSILVNAVMSSGFVLHLLTTGHSPAFALASGGAMAICVGLVNGLLIALGELPPLVVTLASSLLMYGIGREVWFKQQSVVVPPNGDGFFQHLDDRWIGVPVPLVVLVVAAIVVHAALTFTVSGHFLYAKGDNYFTARLTGIPVRSMTVLSYTVAAALAFAAGLVMTAQGGALGERQAQSSMLYDVITVAVIGGVSLAGGRGRVMGLVAGTLLVGIVLNALTLLNFTADQQVIVKGAVLLAALAADAVLHPRTLDQLKAGDL